MLGLEEFLLPLAILKIAVIKHLPISKITHLLLNLPDPEDNILDELNTLLYKLNTLLYNFLWRGKTDKIKRFGMCQGYEVGGLKNQLA